MNHSMTRDQQIGVCTVVVATLALIGAFFVPEVRRAIGLDKLGMPQVDVSEKTRSNPETSRSSENENNLPKSPAVPDARSARQSTRAGAPLGAAEISSIGPVSPQAWQRIVIKGAHFGMGQPFNGCSDFMRVTNLTAGHVFGAFAPGGFCYAPVLVTSWTDSEIVIEGFPSFKRGQEAFKIGDVIKIQVANFTQEGWVTSGDNFKGAPVAWCSVRVGPQ
jgi:hypothetical protein